MPIVFQLENDQNRSLHDDAISILSKQFGAKLPNQNTNFARIIREAIAMKGWRFLL